MTFNPLRDPKDYIVLAGRSSPGIADVIGAESARDFAVRQPPFTTGARILFRRRKLAEFSVKIRLYTDADHLAWEEWSPIVLELPNARRVPKALDIQHPQLEDLDIKSVVVRSVSQAEQTDHGEWTYTIKMLESRPRPKVSIAPIEGSKAAPKDPVDTLIEDLAGDLQAERLANG